MDAVLTLSGLAAFGFGAASGLSVLLKRMRLAATLGLLAAVPLVIVLVLVVPTGADTVATAPPPAPPPVDPNGCFQMDASFGSRQLSSLTSSGFAGTLLVRLPADFKEFVLLEPMNGGYAMYSSLNPLGGLWVPPSVFEEAVNNTSSSGGWNRAWSVLRHIQRQSNTYPGISELPARAGAFPRAEDCKPPSDLRALLASLKPK